MRRNTNNLKTSKAAKPECFGKRCNDIVPCFIEDSDWKQQLGGSDWVQQLVAASSLRPKPLAASAARPIGRDKMSISHQEGSLSVWNHSFALITTLYSKNSEVKNWSDQVEHGAEFADTRHKTFDT